MPEVVNRGEHPPPSRTTLGAQEISGKRLKLSSRSRTDT
jgi:hypothetical protein